MGDDGYPGFLDGELRRRFGLVRELMAGQGVEALLLHGAPLGAGSWLATSIPHGQFEEPRRLLPTARPLRRGDVVRGASRRTR